jgi:NTE family protein
LNFSGVGFFSNKALMDFIGTNIPCKNFEELKIQLFATATNLEEGKYEVFSEGEILNPVAASAAVPVMFNPVIINGKKYVDGGVLNNFPVEPLTGICDVIIGSNVSAWPEKHDKWTKTLIIQRSYQLAINANLESKMALCDVIIDPPVGHFMAFSKSKIRELVEIGYRATLDQTEAILSLFQKP